MNPSYKDKALSSLNGKWGSAVIAYLVYFLIAGALVLVITIIVQENHLEFNPSSLWSLLMLPLGWGVNVYYLNIIRNRDTSVGKIFEGFNYFGKVFPTMFLVNIFIVLWALLFIIPGIIKSYSYAMTPYILKDKPNIDSNSAIDESCAMMDGHKGELFMLDLSFIGWFLLGCLTLGLGFLFIMPYWLTTRAQFYEKLKGESSENTSYNTYSSANSPLAQSQGSDVIYNGGHNAGYSNSSNSGYNTNYNSNSQYTNQEGSSGEFSGNNPYAKN